MDDEAVEREVELEASVAEVWASLTEPERLSAWLGGTVELDLRPGGRGSVRREDGAVRRIVVEALEPERRMAIRWWPFEEPGDPGRPGRGSRVEFLLESLPFATRLRVVERAPLPTQREAPEEFDAIGKAWDSSGLGAMAR
ncbi:MAG: SRPBCC domain-containing protein [Actinomycetota bacterium]